MHKETFEFDICVHYFDFDYGFMDTYVKTYQLLYFKYGKFIVYQSYLNKAVKSKSNSHQPIPSIVTVLCPVMTETYFGMEYFLVMYVRLRIPESFLDICFPSFRLLSLFTMHAHISLNLKNDFGSTFAIIPFPISPQEVSFSFKSVSAITCCYCLIHLLHFSSGQIQLQCQFNAILLRYQTISMHSYSF